MTDKKFTIPHSSRYATFPFQEDGYEGICRFEYAYIKILAAILSNAQALTLEPEAAANMAFDYTCAALQKIESY